MSYRLPPLNALRAFEAAGRHSSFKLAAMELSVTAGAVSQQVKHLEQVLGIALFQRLHNGLVLTPRGEDYLGAVSDAMERLSVATDEISRSLTVRTLRVGISPKLAEKPAALLSAGGDAAAELRFVRTTSTDDVADLLSGALDALVRPGPGPYPGLHAEELALTDTSGASRSAMLVTWPGLAQCREVAALRRVLAGQAPD